MCSATARKQSISLALLHPRSSMHGSGRLRAGGAICEASSGCRASENVAVIFSCARSALAARPAYAGFTLAWGCPEGDGRALLDDDMPGASGRDRRTEEVTLRTRRLTPANDVVCCALGRIKTNASATAAVASLLHQQTGSGPQQCPRAESILKMNMRSQALMWDTGLCRTELRKANRRCLETGLN